MSSLFKFEVSRGIASANRLISRRRLLTSSNTWSERRLEACAIFFPCSCLSLDFQRCLQTLVFPFCLQIQIGPVLHLNPCRIRDAELFRPLAASESKHQVKVPGPYIYIGRSNGHIMNYCATSALFVKGACSACLLPGDH